MRARSLLAAPGRSARGPARGAGETDRARGEVRQPVFLRTRNGLAPLRFQDVEAAIELAGTDPAVNALAGSRLVELGRPSVVASEFLGRYRDGDLASLCWLGANLSPIAASPEDLADFAGRIARGPRRSSSVVGDSAAVGMLWRTLGPVWQGEVREYRWHQPLLEAVASPDVVPDPRVREARPDELDRVLPAAVEMFREEVGTDPTRWDGGRSYRARFRWLIENHRSYIVTAPDGRVIFKADVGALFGGVAQIHGVWVAQDQRAQGLARSAMARMVELVRQRHAGRVTLYVNDFNRHARSAYAAAGFREIGELATILFH